MSANPSTDQPRQQHLIFEYLFQETRIVLHQPRALNSNESKIEGEDLLLHLTGRAPSQIILEFPRVKMKAISVLA